jgi:hypothetical protein
MNHRRSLLAPARPNRDSGAMRRLIGMAILALVIGCALGAGTASAASRGFKVMNNSDNDLTVLAAQTIVEPPCAGCAPVHFDIGFEGRPKDGSTLEPEAIDRWELKHWFNPFKQGPHYAAELIYKINGTPAAVVWNIYTYNYSNESNCELHGELSVILKFGCKAKGLNLEFHNAN